MTKTDKVMELVTTRLMAISRMSKSVLVRRRMPTIIAELRVELGALLDEPKPKKKEPTE